MPFLCVFGCKNPGAALHVFPNPEKYPERFKTWTSIVGEKLDTLTEIEVYKKKRICDVHFLPEHKNRNNRLSILAVPLLHLPDDTDSIAVTAPPATNDSRSAEANIPFGDSASIAVTAPPAISDSSSAEVTIPIVEHRHIGAKVSASIVLEDNHSIKKAKLTTPKREHRHEAKALSIVLQDHNYFVKRPKRTIAKHTAGVQGGICQQKLKNLQNTIYQLRRKSRTFKERLASAQKLGGNVAFNFVTKNMTKPAKLFVHMQLQSTKKPKGRRFSIEEKVLCLSLYKKSPKCYRLLNKYFALPSSKAMKHLLSQIKIVPGINPILFQKLKITIENKEVSDRLCSLIFDEMSITPNISYNAQKDSFEGFACNQENLFTNHVLVFMVKGVKKNFKQPIAYYYTNSLRKSELKILIKNVIKHALESGLIIVNTVCDQSTVNVGAINDLIDDTKALFLRRGKECRYDFIRVNGRNIIPLYDTPHLIKGIRNNLITKNLCYVTNNVKKIIKWEHYQMVYAADKSFGELRLLDKLTEEHVNPDKINKMRVKTATQLFSHSVAVVTEHLTARGVLPDECRQLIDFTLLLDKLFDSLNISTFTIPNGKIYKGPVKKNSPHHQLWQRAKEILKTVKFIKITQAGGETNETEIVVPSISNLVKTIEGMESLWKVLSNQYNFDAMLTRNFNQDPVENFFGNIRSFGGRNVSPDTVAFEGAYKALLLNGFNAPHSRRANCEADGSECLQTLKFFLRGESVTPGVPSDAVPNNNEDAMRTINFNVELGDSLDDDAGQRNYVCGWVLKKCLKVIVKTCRKCRRDLLDDASVNKNNEFIKRKEFVNKKWLCYPNVITEKYFKEIQSTAISCLKKNTPKKYVKGTIISLLELLVPECPFKCKVHKNKLKDYFINTSLNVLIYSWCRSINRILQGKITYDGEDEIKLAAQKYFYKYKNYKNRK